MILAAPRRTETEHDRTAWPLSTTLALAAELALLIAFALVWEIDGRAPARAGETVLLLL